MSPAPRRFRFPRLFWLRERHSVEEEFAHHFALVEEELRAGGMSPDDAQREARRRFGDSAEAAAFCQHLDDERHRLARSSLIADEIAQDTRYAWRQITRHRGYAIATISVLTLGLALFMTALCVANAYLLRGLPFPESQRLVTVRMGPTAEFFHNMPNLQGVDWTIPAREFDGVVAWDLDGFTIMGGDHPEPAEGAWVSPGYFDVLGVHPSVGRGFDSTEFSGTAKVAIISNALWKRRWGGDPKVIGTPVRMFSIDRPGEQELVTIVGVLPADAWHVNRFTDVLRPLTTPRTFYIARLKAGQSIETATDRLNASVLPQVPAHDSAWSMSLASLHEDYVRQAKPAIVALVLAACIVLLIVIANTAAMSAVRSVRRAGEFAVRAALGAGRGRIARQAIVESLALTGVAAVLATALTRIILGAIGPAVEQRLGLTVPGGANFFQFDARVATIVTGIVLLSALATAWRAMRVHRVSLNVSLRPGETAGAGKARIRHVLMGAQIAFTFALLSGAALMARTAWNVTHDPLGFDPSGVYSGWVLLPQSRFTTDSTRIAGTNALVATAQELPDVRVAAAAWPPPFYGGAPIVVHDVDQPSLRADASMTWASADYFQVLRIGVLEGRVFSPNDNARSEPVIVIGERLSRKLWPHGGAVGSRLRAGEGADAPVRTVIGVVRDTKMSGTEPVAEAYLPLSQNPRRMIAMMVRWRNDIAGNTNELRNAFARIDESLALANAQPLTNVVAQQTVRPRSLSALLIAFSSFGLVLSAIGLAASLAHGVAQRRPELALRLALGASPAQIFSMIVRDAALLVALSVAAGGALSVVVARALSAQLYGVRATDPLTYAGMAMIVAVVAFMAAVIPARRAARVDPAKTLRAG